MSVIVYIDGSAPDTAQLEALERAGVTIFKTANAMYFSGLLAGNGATKRIIADCTNHEAIANAAKAAGYEFAKLSDLKPVEPAKAESTTPKAPAPKSADAVKAAEGG